VFLASTYRDIIRNLADAIEGQASLHLKSRVTWITHREEGDVQVRAARESGPEFVDVFDDVIVTAPLGWLKRHQHIFIPQLPPALSDAIEELGYGSLERVFIMFPKAFWEDEFVSEQYLGSLQTTTDCWQSEQDTSPQFPIESLFLRPNYAVDTNPAQWRQEIICYSSLPKELNQPLIMFFIYGQWGRHITGLVRGLQPYDYEYQRILDENFKPYYSKLPHWDEKNPNCTPCEFLSTDWQNDEFAGNGSFTNLPVGAGDCAVHLETLRKGMGEERGIWFAGEHTSPPGGLGTVHGAYWSGEEVAVRVAKQYGVILEIEETSSPETMQGSPTS
jgi:hypothetical protein